MKISEITLKTIKTYLRIEEDMTDDDELLELYLESAKGFVESYVGLGMEELDKLPEVTMAVLTLVSEFYENRMATVLFAPSHVNEILDRLLSLHGRNFV